MEIIGRLIKINYLMFQDIYFSQDEFHNYYSKFLNIYKKPERALYELANLSRYFLTMKTTEQNNLKTIMFISLIERLNSDKDFITFPEWISNKELNKASIKEINKFYNDYKKEHGCSSKFRAFFQVYLTKEEKIQFIKSIKYYPKLSDGSDSHNLFPFCFEENNCRPSYLQSCPLVNYEKEDCLICKDEDKLKKTLNELAEFLYYYRSKFVHEARMFGLSEPKLGNLDGASMSFSPLDYVNYKFSKLKKPKYEGLIIVDLNAKMLENVLERNFKKLLANFIKVRESIET